jgi:hypothetical protein
MSQPSSRTASEGTHPVIRRTARPAAVRRTRLLTVDAVTYSVGSIKRDPETLAVAVRTEHPDHDKAWGIMTVDNGGHYCAHVDVADCADVAT